MKDNKKFTKLLLATLSVVLVAGISVSATLAYLTATTQIKENNFKSTSAVTGQVLEPSYTTDVNYQPGDTIHKDPLIDNDTEDFPIWVAAKLSFKINVTGDSWETVSYETFKKYAVMRTDDTKTFAEALNSNWTSFGTASDGNLYVYYNSSIAKDSPLGESDPGEKGHGGSAGTGSSLDDATAPIFNYVYINPAIRIQSAPESGYTHTVRTTVNTAGPSANDAYDKFNIKIFIDGYGVMNDSSDTSISGKTAVLNELKEGLGFPS